jgi:hypothetical protein
VAAKVGGRPAGRSARIRAQTDRFPYKLSVRQAGREFVAFHEFFAVCGSCVFLFVFLAGDKTHRFEFLGMLETPVQFFGEILGVSCF